MCIPLRPTGDCLSDEIGSAACRPGRTPATHRRRFGIVRDGTEIRLAEDKRPRLRVCNRLRLDLICLPRLKHRATPSLRVARCFLCCQAWSCPAVRPAPTPPSESQKPRRIRARTQPGGELSGRSGRRPEADRTPVFPRFLLGSSVLRRPMIPNSPEPASVICVKAGGAINCLVYENPARTPRLTCTASTSLIRRGPATVLSFPRRNRNP